MVSGRGPWVRGTARNTHPAVCRQCEARVAHRRDHRRHRANDRRGAGDSRRTATFATRASVANCSNARRACTRVSSRSGSSIKAGDPARVTQRHDGCGAAIRVAPVGILYRSDRLDEIVAAAREASISTHGGALAIAAAAATAAAVSAAIDGASALEIIGIAEQCGSSGRTRAVGFGRRHVRGGVARHPRRPAPMDCSSDPAKSAARYFPRDPLTIVPLALALGTIHATPPRRPFFWRPISAATATRLRPSPARSSERRHPETVNDEWYAVVEAVNRHDLTSLADALAGLRS